MAQVQTLPPETASDDAARAAALHLSRKKFHNRFSGGEAPREQHGHTTTWLRSAPEALPAIRHFNTRVMPG